VPGRAHGDRRRRRWAIGSLLVVSATLAALAAGCGGEDEGRDVAEGPPPVARPENFPKPHGRTIAQLRAKYGEGGPVVALSVSQLEPGRNRLGFGLFDRARAQIADAPVVLYVAPASGGPARGPFPARYESLAVKPQFESRSTAADPNAARSLYVAELPFARPGEYELLALARLDDRLVAASSAGPGLRVKRDGPVPDVGERAPRTSTPTTASVGGDVESIDTRVPPSTMHERDLADVLGRRPVLLLFATPALCQSRVCGPVVDIAEQVKASRGDEVEFIHVEIFEDNKVERGYREQVLEWRLPSEPWAFAIDRRGRIRARLEGAFSARELERAVDAATHRRAPSASG
jgi:hypothetical protein